MPQNTLSIDLECPSCDSKLSDGHEFTFVERVENWRPISREDDRLFIASKVLFTEGIHAEFEQQIRCTTCHCRFPFPTNMPFEFE